MPIVAGESSTSFTVLQMNLPLLRTLEPHFGCANLGYSLAVVNPLLVQAEAYSGYFGSILKSMPYHFRTSAALLPFSHVRTAVSGGNLHPYTSTAAANLLTCHGWCALTGGFLDGHRLDARAWGIIRFTLAAVTRQEVQAYSTQRA